MWFSRSINFILVIISIILGIIIANLFAAGSIPYIRTLAKLNLIISTLFLLIYVAVLLLAAFLKNQKIISCSIVPGVTLMISCLGTLITSTIASVINVIAALTSSRILVGFGGFFFTLMFMSFVFLVLRILCKSKLFPIL